MRICTFTWSRFLIKNLLIDSLLTPLRRVHTWIQGRSQTFLFGGATGGASFATRGLSMVCVGLSEWNLKNFGGARQKFGGAVAPPGTPLASPLLEYKHVQVRITAKIVKAEHSRLITSKHTENLVLLTELWWKALPQVSLQKSLDSQKNHYISKKITRF